MDATRAKILESFLNAYFTPFEKHIFALGDAEPIATAESIIQEIMFQAEQAQYAMRCKTRTVGKRGITFFQDNWIYYAPQLANWRGHQIEVYYNDKVDALWVILPDGLPCRVTRVVEKAIAEAA